MTGCVGENSCCHMVTEWMNLSCQEMKVLSAQMVKKPGTLKILTLRCCQVARRNTSDSDVKQRILACSRLLSLTKTENRGRAVLYVIIAILG